MNKKTSQKRTSDKKKKEVKRRPNQKVSDKKKRNFSHTKNPSRKKKHKHPKTKKKNKRKRQSVKRAVLELISAIGMTGCLIWLVSLISFTFVKVDGYGMMPNLASKETVFVNKFSQKNRFDLVLVKVPNTKKTMVRRIIGMPKESIRYDKDRLYINNQVVEEKFIAQEIQQADASGSFYTKDFSSNRLFNESILPKGKYLVLGDNRPYSTDSRFYGLIDERDIVGVVKMRVFPLHKMTKF